MAAGEFVHGSPRCACLHRQPRAQVEAALLAAGGDAAAVAEVDTTVVASIQLIYATGWAPHDSQPQPLARGAAAHHMADIGSAKPAV